MQTWDIRTCASQGEVYLVGMVRQRFQQHYVVRNGKLRLRELELRQGEIAAIGFLEHAARGAQQGTAAYADLG